MWPLPKLSNQLVTIQYYPGNLICSWIQPHGKQHKVHAYQRHSFDSPCQQATLFNPTTTQQLITQFLHRHNLHDAAVMMSTSGQGITESIVKVATASPHAHDFNLPALRKQVWDYHYLYPTDHAAYAFYLCGMSRPLLLQYKLLAINASLNLVGITTQFMATLALYQHMYGATFRRAQLARDMTQAHNQLLNTLCPDTLRRMLIVPPHMGITLEQELPWLSTSLGLYIAGRKL